MRITTSAFIELHINSEPLLLNINLIESVRPSNQIGKAMVYTEIENQRSLLAGIPEGEAFLAQYMNERLAKINALKSIYLIGTGTRYD